MNRLFALPVVFLFAVVVSGCGAGDYESTYSGGTAVEQPERQETTPEQSTGISPTVAASNDAATSVDDKEVMAKLRELRAIFSKSSDKTRIHSISFVTLRDRENFETVLDVIGGCPEIKSLDMKSSLVTDDDLKKVSAIPSVVSLTLNKTGITDKGIGFISQMPNLETLYLADTKITNASIPAIAQAKSLRILEISTDGVNGGLAPIATLPQLNWLLLREVTIKDDSLTTLGASPSLSRLTLTGSTIEDSASLAKLKSSAPGITINE